MQSLSQADCLVLWESGRALHPIDQGLLYVHAAFPESRYEAIADWPLGRRNHALAELHCATFGRWLRGWTACERCEAKLECEVDGHALLASGAEPRTESIAIAGSEFRLPTSRDWLRSPANPVLPMRCCHYWIGAGSPVLRKAQN